MICTANCKVKTLIEPIHHHHDTHRKKMRTIRQYSRSRSKSGARGGAASPASSPLHLELPVLERGRRRFHFLFLVAAPEPAPPVTPPRRSGTPPVPSCGARPMKHVHRYAKNGGGDLGICVCVCVVVPSSLDATLTPLSEKQVMDTLQSGGKVCTSTNGVFIFIYFYQSTSHTAYDMRQHT